MLCQTTDEDFNNRILRGELRRLPMPGLFEVRQELPIGVAIEEILLLAEGSLEGIYIEKREGKKLEQIPTARLKELLRELGVE
jgi:hypothetical protein